jgi:adenosine deaminase
VKKNVLENIVPIVIELKRYLEKRRSPLLKNVMEYLKEMLKDYKEEISGLQKVILVLLLTTLFRHFSCRQTIS